MSTFPSRSCHSAALFGCIVWGTELSHQRCPVDHHGGECRFCRRGRDLERDLERDRDLLLHSRTGEDLRRTGERDLDRPRRLGDRDRGRSHRRSLWSLGSRNGKRSLSLFANGAGLGGGGGGWEDDIGSADGAMPQKSLEAGAVLPGAPAGGAESAPGVHRRGEVPHSAHGHAAPSDPPTTEEALDGLASRGGTRQALLPLHPLPLSSSVDGAFRTAPEATQEPLEDGVLMDWSTGEASQNDLVGERFPVNEISADRREEIPTGASASAGGGGKPARDVGGGGGGSEGGGVTEGGSAAKVSLSTANWASTACTGGNFARQIAQQQ